MAWTTAIKAVLDGSQGQLASIGYAIVVPSIMKWLMVDYARVCSLLSVGSLTDAEVIRCLHTNPAFNSTSFNRDSALNLMMLESDQAIYPDTAYFWVWFLLLVAVVVPFLDLFLFLKTHAGRNMMVLTVCSRVVPLPVNSRLSHFRCFTAWTLIVFGGDLILVTASTMFWLYQYLSHVVDRQGARLFALNSDDLPGMLGTTVVLVFLRLVLNGMITMVKNPRFINPESGRLDMEEGSDKDTVWVRGLVEKQLGLTLRGLRLFQDRRVRHRDVEVAKDDFQSLQRFKARLETLSPDLRSQLVRPDESSVIDHKITIDDLSDHPMGVSVSLEGLSDPVSLGLGGVCEFKLSPLSPRRVTIVVESQRFLNKTPSWKYTHPEPVDLSKGMDIHVPRGQLQRVEFVGLPAATKVRIANQKPIPISIADPVLFRVPEDNTVIVRDAATEFGGPGLELKVQVTSLTRRVIIPHVECLAPDLPHDVEGLAELTFGESTLLMPLGRGKKWFWPTFVAPSKSQVVLNGTEEGTWGPGKQVIHSWECSGWLTELHEFEGHRYVPMDLMVVCFEAPEPCRFRVGKTGYHMGRGRAAADDVRLLVPTHRSFTLGYEGVEYAVKCKETNRHELSLTIKLAPGTEPTSEDATIEAPHVAVEVRDP
jgi:hypothetical protein